MLEKLYAYRRNKISTSLKTIQWWYYIEADIYIPISITRIPHLNGVEYIDIKDKNKPYTYDSRKAKLLIMKWTPKEYRHQFGYKYNGKWYWKGYRP